MKEKHNVMDSIVGPLEEDFFKTSFENPPNVGKFNDPSYSEKPIWSGKHVTKNLNSGKLGCFLKLNNMN